MTIIFGGKQSLPKSYTEIRRPFRDAMDTALLELADYLQRNSPRGVSVGADSLAGGWQVKPASKQRGILEIRGEVYNTATAAEFRIRGRGPGKYPPFHKGSSLAKWGAAKGIPAFLIARKIAKEGTERWRTKDNILKQDPVTLKYAPDSPMFTIYQKTLAAEIAKIKL